ncbi:TPA: group II intron reverse transcriptase/maturase [Candidatus Poribacteria bacterium]|nr:group II intron reverse transcriptase/maturase [Candidatus Poribacteria bacterium]
MRVSQNRGSPGVDGVSIEDFERDAQERLAQIQRELISRTYSHSPVRKFKLKSVDGSEREIAIPTVKDRIVQVALHKVLSPVFEPTFLESSFAYRPHKGALKAVRLVQELIQAGYHWVLRTDIDDFFDTIDHEILMRMVSERVKEPEILDLIETMLKVEVFDNMSFRECEVGVIQGSGLSPLLANIYLTPFDRYMTQRGYEMIRYADDIALFGREEDEVRGALQEIGEMLEGLKLSLNEDKTHIYNVREEGFVFLGYRFDSTGRRASQKASEIFRLKLESLQEEIKAMPPMSQIQQFLVSIRGWRNYYGATPWIDPLNLPMLAALLTSAVETGDRRPISDLAEARLKLDDQSPQMNLHLAELWSRADRREMALIELISPLQDEEREAEAEELLRKLLSEEKAGITDETVERIKGALITWRDEMTPSKLEEISFDLAEMGFYRLAREINRLVGVMKGERRPAAETALPESSKLVASAQVKVEPSQQELEMMLEIFSGREGAFAVEGIDSMGVRVFRRVDRQIRTSDIKEHIQGRKTVGVYLLRLNNTVSFAVVDVDISRRYLLRADDQEKEELLRRTHQDALRIAAAAEKLGVKCYIEDSGYKGRHCWFFFQEPIKGETAKEFLQRITEQAGKPSPSINWELFPQQTRVKENQFGQLIKLPLGVHSKSGRRCLLLDEAGLPYEDQMGVLKNVEPIPPEKVNRILNIKTAIDPFGEDESWIVEMFPDMELTVKVISGCNVLKFLCKKSKETNWLEHHERLLILRTVGHLGEEGKRAIHAIMRHTLNYSERITDRFISRLEPYPLSCARIRGNYPELTANLRCNCRFRLPPGGYPSPILHALRVDQVPVMKEKMERIEEEREERSEKRELKEQAASLVQKLSELRRHMRGIQASIQKCERELEELFREHDVQEVELELGVLRMVKEDDRVKWVIEV